MSKFWKIETFDYYQTGLMLQKYLPELKKSSGTDIEDNLRGSGLFLVRKQSVKKPVWMRITLPFGLIFMLLLLIILPIKFMIVGSWGYRIKWINNWFSALGF